MTKPFVRSAYNYDVREAGRRCALICEDETLTKQEFKDECDINTILRRFNVTGELPEGVRMPTYGDFSEVRDFHEAANAIAVANEAFSAMPADVRKRFQNDAGAFVAFCSDAANLDEARKLGLVLPAPVEAPVPASGAVGAAPASASSPGGAPAVPAAPAASTSSPSSGTLPT